jgi:amidase
LQAWKEGQQVTSGSSHEAIHYESLLDVARRIERGEISSVELTQHMLARVEELDPRLHSYVTVTPEQALEAARQADQDIAEGRYRGPLHGSPVAVKDLCWTRGIRTTAGSGVLRDFVPGEDATVVSRLRAAGAVILGKLSLPEGAMVGYHPDFAVPVNPWRSDYWPGGSSSGSGVAVAAGLCFAAIGTDTGGSIRFPSMANGVVGFKPTYGRVSRHGVITLADSMDHVGTMARSVGDAAAMLEAIAGWDERDQSSLRTPVPDMMSGLHDGAQGMRLGIDRRFCEGGCEAGLVEAIYAATETWRGLGAEVVEVQMPEGWQALREAWFALCAVEAVAAHEATFPSRAAEYGPYFREFLGLGATIGAEQQAIARALRTSYSARFEEVLSNVDAVVAPSGGSTMPVPPELAHQGFAAFLPVAERVHMASTVPADFAGTPTLTLPCGLAAEGVPYAVQLMGQRGSEAKLCRIGQAFEDVTSWHTRHPPVTRD